MEYKTHDDGHFDTRRWGTLEICAICKCPTTFYAPGPFLPIVTQRGLMAVVGKKAGVEVPVCVECLIKAIRRLQEFIPGVDDDPTSDLLSMEGD